MYWPRRAADSYLNENALLSAALATGCDSLHPGYGFLSENADFADACRENGITFIGPSGDSIRRAGSKSAARELMRVAGVPVTPGSDGPVNSVEDALAAAERVGYPVLLKASAGGGGRGIRRCDSADTPAGTPMPPRGRRQRLASAMMKCILKSWCWSPGILNFRFWRTGRAMSSIWATGTAPSSAATRSSSRRPRARCLTPALRAKMGDAAVRAAQAVHYEGAGTVEFLLDADGTHFYFMEMNTRIQVEHGITELVTGVDLYASSSALPPACRWIWGRRT